MPTILGAILGASLLLRTSSRTFDILVPLLILLASILLVVQKRLKEWAVANEKKVPAWMGFVIQFFVSTYGGYFGAGMGIMMLAAFSLYVDGNIHEHNALKNWLGVLINFSASVPLIIAGAARLNLVFPIIVGALLGGYVAAKVAQRIQPDRLRLAIAIYGFSAAGYFVLKAFKLV